MSRSSRSARPSAGEIRPSVALVALGIIAAAIALVATSLLSGPATSLEETRWAVVEPAVPKQRAPEVAAPTPLPTSRSAESDARSYRSPAVRRSGSRPRPTPASTEIASTPSERVPEWDGKGLPSREWLRWQLGLLVEQAHPEASIPAGAMDLAVEDALAVRSAKLELQQARDPEAFAAAQERFELAAERLSASLGVEGLDFAAF